MSRVFFEKIFLAAIVFAVFAVSSAFFLSQAFNLFPKAVGSITGTIVLSDGFFLGKGNTNVGGPDDGMSISKLGGTVALPGTSCNVQVSGCCTSLINTDCIVAIGNSITLTQNVPINGGCISASGSLAGGQNYLATVKNIANNSLSLAHNLSVSYVCTS